LKTTPYTLQKLKGERPIVAVTAYDALMAHYAGQAGVDVILVGDSVGNTVLGLPGTVPVTLDMMVHHTAAVVRFAEAHFEFRHVLKACQRLMQEAGADAVKIEADGRLAPKVAKLAAAGVPVWGHLGLMPQQVKRLGRYRKFGVNAAEMDTLVADAKALEEAGCFALLLEMVAPAAAAAVTAAVKVPVIGIGAGAGVDGQILVCTDLLGLTPGYVPGFAKKFADAGKLVGEGFAAYRDAVVKKSFP
jgi:3-methyl-2-oxobutanoate hydroxymethyltransferase